MALNPTVSVSDELERVYKTSSDLQRILHTVRTKNDDLVKQIQTKDAQIQSLSHAIQSLELDLKQVHDTNSVQKNQQNLLQQEIAHQKDVVTQFQSRLTELTETLAKTRSELEIVLSENKELRHTKEQIQSHVLELTEKLNTASKSLEETKSKCVLLEKENKDFKSSTETVDYFRKVCAEYQELVHSTTNALEECEKDQEKLQLQLKNMSLTKSQLESKVEEQRKEIEKLKSDVLLLAKVAEDEHEQSNDLWEKKKDLENQFTELKEKHLRSEDQVVYLQRVLYTMQDESKRKLDIEKTNETLKREKETLQLTCNDLTMNLRVANASLEDLKTKNKSQKEVIFSLQREVSKYINDESEGYKKKRELIEQELEPTTEKLMESRRETLLVVERLNIANIDKEKLLEECERNRVKAETQTVLVNQMKVDLEQTKRELDAVLNECKIIRSERDVLYGNCEELRVLLETSRVKSNKKIKQKQGNEGDEIANLKEKLRDQKSEMKAIKIKNIELENELKNIIISESSSNVNKTNPHQNNSPSTTNLTQKLERLRNKKLDLKKSLSKSQEDRVALERQVREYELQIYRLKEELQESNALHNENHNADHNTNNENENFQHSKVKPLNNTYYLDALEVDRAISALKLQISQANGLQQKIQNELFAARSQCQEYLIEIETQKRTIDTLQSERERFIKMRDNGVRRAEDNREEAMKMLENARREKETLTSRLHNLTLTLRSAEDQSVAWKSQVDQLKLSLLDKKAIEEKLAILTEQAKKDKQNSKHEMETEIEKERAKYKSEIERLKAKIDEERNRLKDLEQTIVDLKTEWEKSKSRAFEDAQKEFESQKKDLESFWSKKLEEKITIQTEETMKTEREEHYKRVKTLEHECAKAFQKVETLVLALDEKEAEIERLVDILRNGEEHEALRLLRNELDEWKKKCEDLEKERTEMRIQLSRETEALENLKEMSRSKHKMELQMERMLMQESSTQEREVLKAELKKWVEREREEWKSRLEQVEKEWRAHSEVASNTIIDLEKQQVVLTNRISVLQTERDALQSTLKKMEDVGQSLNQMETEREILRRAILEARTQLHGVTGQRDMLSDDLVHVFQTLEHLDTKVQNVQ